MATGTLPPKQPGDIPQIPPRVDPYDSFIQARLEQTRRQVKWWEIASGLVTLAVAVLAYLLAAAVIDHWVLPQGLGLGGRILLWGGLLIGCGWYFGRHVLPLLLHPINPVFAAYTIEQSRPSFKNALINFLFLRREQDRLERDDLAKRVFESLEMRTAAELSHTPVETAVDRSRVIRLGYVLAILVGLCLVYAMVSPKSPMASFRRVIWPWSDVAAPTRAFDHFRQAGRYDGLPGRHAHGLGRSARHQA